VNRRQRRRLEARARTGKAESVPFPEHINQEVEAVAADVSTAFVDAVLSGVDETSPTLEPGTRRLVGETTLIMRQYMSSQTFKDTVAKKIDEAVEPILIETIAEWMPRIEERIRAQVSATFEARIDMEVRQRVDAAIEEVRKKIISQ